MQRLDGSRTKGSVMTTRRIVMAGVLSAIAVMLGVTGWGYIPVPNMSGSATVMAIPAIIGGVIEGPIVGGIIGCIFGISSFLQDTAAIYFKDPLVSIAPRIFIGIVAYLVYAGLKRAKMPMWLNLVVTGVLGSATNTVLVLFMIGVRFHVAAKPLATVAATNGVAEAVLAAVLTTAVVMAYYGVTRPGGRSKIS
jgi:uncharacterized membrane protein